MQLQTSSQTVPRSALDSSTKFYQRHRQYPELCSRPGATPVQPGGRGGGRSSGLPDGGSSLPVPVGGCGIPSTISRPRPSSDHLGRGHRRRDCRGAGAPRPQGVAAQDETRNGRQDATRSSTRRGVQQSTGAERFECALQSAESGAISECEPR